MGRFLYGGFFCVKWKARNLRQFVLSAGGNVKFRSILQRDDLLNAMIVLGDEDLVMVALGEEGILMLFVLNVENQLPSRLSLRLAGNLFSVETVLIKRKLLNFLFRLNE